MSLITQVEQAGEFISDLYTQLQASISTSSWEVVRSRFFTEEDFERDFIVPLMINAYNAGAARVAEAVELYVSSVYSEDMSTGKDLFLEVADVAQESKQGLLSRYGTEARAYVRGVYASAAVLRAPAEQK